MKVAGSRRSAVYPYRYRSSRGFRGTHDKRNSIKIWPHCKGPSAKTNSAGTRRSSPQPNFCPELNRSSCDSCRRRPIPSYGVAKAEFGEASAKLDSGFIYSAERIQLQCTKQPVRSKSSRQLRQRWKPQRHAQWTAKLSI